MTVVLRPSTHPSPERLTLSCICLCFPQQPNIKQKFVALLKRFKVTDEVREKRVRVLCVCVCVL